MLSALIGDDMPAEFEVHCLGENGIVVTAPVKDSETDGHLSSDTWGKVRQQARNLLEMLSGSRKDNDLPAHVGVECDGCQMTPILGIRHRSLTRYNYDLCDTCMKNPVRGGHQNPQEEYERIEEPRGMLRELFSDMSSFEGALSFESPPLNVASSEHAHLPAEKAAEQAISEEQLLAVVSELHRVMDHYGPQGGPQHGARSAVPPKMCRCLVGSIYAELHVLGPCVSVSAKECAVRVLLRLMRSEVAEDHILLMMMRGGPLVRIFDLVQRQPPQISQDLQKEAAGELMGLLSTSSLDGMLLVEIQEHSRRLQVGLVGGGNLIRESRVVETKYDKVVVI